MAWLVSDTGDGFPLILDRELLSRPGLPEAVSKRPYLLRGPNEADPQATVTESAKKG